MSLIEITGNNNSSNFSINSDNTIISNNSNINNNKNDISNVEEEKITKFAGKAYKEDTVNIVYEFSDTGYQMNVFSLNKIDENFSKLYIVRDYQLRTDDNISYYGDFVTTNLPNLLIGYQQRGITFNEDFTEIRYTKEVPLLQYIGSDTLVNDPLENVEGGAVFYLIDIKDYF